LPCHSLTHGRSQSYLSNLTISLTIASTTTTTSTYSRPRPHRENAKLQKSQTLAKKLAEIEERRIKQEISMAQVLEREKKIQEEKMRQSLELEIRVNERMAKLDERRAPSPPRERMGRAGWAPVGVLPCLMGRSPTGMAN
jgi:hypothetical protein